MPVPRIRPPFSLPHALLDSYATNQRLTDYLLEHLDDEAWRADPPVTKGRTIAAIVAHMHNVRLMLLKMAKAKRVPAQLDRHKVTKAQARKGLQASHDAMAELLATALAENDGRVTTGVHREVAGLYTQLVNHDAHHRGQICAQARMIGFPLTQDTQLGMWDWSRRANEAVRAPVAVRPVAARPAAKRVAGARAKTAPRARAARGRPVNGVVRS